MKKTNQLILLAMLLLESLSVAAQDVHFSQFYENTVLRNPSLTGIFTGDYKVTVNYRNQWSGLGSPFSTVLASGETKIPMKNDGGDVLSVGLNIYYDKAGAISFNSMAGYLAINYSKTLDDRRHTFLSVGLAGGYLQRSFDMSKMTFGNQYQSGNFTPYTGAENLQQTKLSNFDIGAGVSLNSSLGSANQTQYYLGVGGYHVQQPQQTFEDPHSLVRLTTRWTGSMGLQTLLSENIGITIHAYGQWQQPYREIIGGALLSFSTTDYEKHTKMILSAGCFYRLSDAIIPTLKVEYARWGLILSYDLPTESNRMYIRQAGGYEISLFNRGLYRRKYSKRDPLICPRFESLFYYQ